MERSNNAGASSRRWTCEACGCNTNSENDRTCSICGTSSGMYVEDMNDFPCSVKSRRNLRTSQREFQIFTKVSQEERPAVHGIRLCLCSSKAFISFPKDIRR